MFAECNNFEEICCIMLLGCRMMGCRKNMVICRGRLIFILLRKMYQMGRKMGRLLRRSTKTTQDQYKLRRVRFCNAIIILIIKMMIKITKNIYDDEYTAAAADDDDGADVAAAEDDGPNSAIMPNNGVFTQYSTCFNFIGFGFCMFHLPFVNVTFNGINLLYGGPLPQVLWDTWICIIHLSFNRGWCRPEQVFITSFCLCKWIPGYIKYTWFASGSFLCVFRW